MCLTGPRRHWVVLGSFIPWPILWDSYFSSIRVKLFLLNLTLVSRYHFHPESPLLMMIVCGTWRPWRYSPLLTRELMFITFAIPLPPSTLMDNYLQLLFLHSSPVGLVITRYLETLVVVSIILELIALLFLVTWIPLRLIIALIEYPLIPSCSWVSQKSSKYYSIFRKSSGAFGSWNSCLLALWLIP